MPFKIEPGRVIHFNDYEVIDAEILFEPPLADKPVEITASTFARKMTGARIQRTMLQMIMESLCVPLRSVVNDVLGVPYQKEGNSLESGFDTAGLIQYIFNRVEGIGFPNEISNQMKAVAQLPINETQPGDLLVWGTAALPTTAGIYIGGGKYITVDMLSEKVVIKYISRKWLPDFVGAIR
ncbi:NlpC/P60 family protein [Weissella sagaensis]|uniref:NlpC/P60 family protein n=1 Tax=Weissella sagaensis TaxID=2559928 RepID=A0ABW1RU81_9LACO|nr:NlpC/P60 family protein [Weissella sagaensis]KAA8433334.1 NlpC/P60 family protein [Weissella paramesenteroides]QDJ59314.1 peptidoglycan endopeptidase [Weissella hellenica]KAA8439235.1 NlpC/P60 family protein [Weissella paramesenteroides]QEA56626.1 NlpC/P60 family protein [Weissella hellenica]UEG67437.1 C40 family peptidase [Weissella hellenica]